MTYLRILLTLLYMATCFQTWSQSKIVRRYLTEDGLSSRSILDVSIDSMSYMWICAESDVNVFDGNSFKTLNTALYNKMNVQSCKKLLAHNDRLLIQSLGDPNNFSAYNLKTGLAKSLDIRKLFVDFSEIKQLKTENNWYVSAKKKENIKIFVFDFEQFNFTPEITISNKDRAAQSFVFSPIQDDKHFIMFDNLEWIIINKQNQIIDKNRAQPLTNTLGKPKKIYIDKLNRIWLQFDQSDLLYRFNLEKNKIIPVKQIKPSGNKLIFNEDKHNNLILVDNTERNTNAVYRISASNEVQLDTNILKINTNIIKIFGENFDRKQWIASYEGLIMRPVKNPFVRSIYAKKINSPLEGNIVRGVAVDNTDVYFTTEQYSLPKKFSAFDQQKSISEINYFSKSTFFCNYDLKIKDNKIWRVGCDDKREGRIESYDLTNRTYSLIKDKNHFRTFDFYKDYLFVASYDDQNKSDLFVAHKDLKKISPLTYKDTNPIKDLALKINYLKVYSDSLWIATNQGLYHYDIESKSIRAFSDNPELKNLYILYFLIKDRTFYLCTKSKGLVVYDTDTDQIQTFDMANGLSNGTAASVYIDHKANIWVPTFKGLNVIRPDHTLGYFFEEDGISNNEFNRYAIASIDSSKVYFGTLNGLTELDLSNYHKQKAPPIRLTQITEIRQDNKAIVHNLRWTQEGELKFNQGVKSLKLEFANPGLLNEDTPHYWIRIKGHQDAWTPLNNDNQFALSNLRHGTYDIEVKSVNALGLVPEKHYKHRIVIYAPLYKRKGFLALMAVVGSIALILYSSNNRVQRIQNREEEKRKVAERFAELELQALRSQMNPHFIFNSLGSIQYFIQTADIQAADSYLTKFAQLMRKYLDASKEKFITLEEEAKLIKLYIDIERLRLDNSFDYKITFDSDIIASDILIPSMLIQPFVENAIVHGLSGLKDRKGFLQIRAFYNNDELNIVIDDNGVGRKVSASKKMAMGKQHKSRGIHIARDRINTLNKIGKANIEIKVVDKLSEDQKPLGTAVVIIIKSQK